MQNMVIFKNKQLKNNSNTINKFIFKILAATTIFKKPIVYGMQTGSVFSNLIGNTFKGAIYLNQSFAFKAPVFYDEEVNNN